MEIELLTAAASAILGYVTAVKTESLRKKDTREKDLLDAYLHIVSLRYEIPSNFFIKINKKVDVEFHKRAYALTKDEEHKNEQLRNIAMMENDLQTYKNCLSQLHRQIARAQIALGFEDRNIYELQKKINAFYEGEAKFGEYKNMNELGIEADRVRDEMGTLVTTGIETHLKNLMEILQRHMHKPKEDLFSLPNKTLIK